MTRSVMDCRPDYFRRRATDNLLQTLSRKSRTPHRCSVLLLPRTSNADLRLAQLVSSDLRLLSARGGRSPAFSVVYTLLLTIQALSILTPSTAANLPPPSLLLSQPLRLVPDPFNDALAGCSDILSRASTTEPWILTFSPTDPPSLTPNGLVTLPATVFQPEGLPACSSAAGAGANPTFTFSQSIDVPPSDNSDFALIARGFTQGSLGIASDFAYAKASRVQNLLPVCPTRPTDPPGTGIPIQRFIFAVFVKNVTISAPTSQSGKVTFFKGYFYALIDFERQPQTSTVATADDGTTCVFHDSLSTQHDIQLGLTSGNTNAQGSAGSTDTTRSSNVSSGTIVGIVAGLLGALIGISVLLVSVYCWRKRNYDEETRHIEPQRGKETAENPAAL